MKEKILLVLLPFWTPLSPPLGITCLKSFLKSRHYNVSAVDASAVEELRDSSKKYFSVLDQHIPDNKKGNFYSIANEVLRNHLMAHINYEDERLYMELVAILVKKTFFFNLEKKYLIKLTQIVDSFYKHLETYFLGLLEQEKPSVLGLSVFSDTLAPSIFCFRLIKNKYPETLTIMGGGVFADLLAPDTPNFKAFLEKTKRIIDKIIIGEGELLFHKILETKASNSMSKRTTKRVYTLDDIDNQQLDICSVEPLDFSDFTLEAYPYLASYTSRSCPFQCAFCSETVQWGKYRKKGIQQIVRELKELSRINNSQLFLMGDSLLNPVINDVAEKLYLSDESIYWEGWLRVSQESCDTTNTLKWRQAGFYHARLGIESGSPRILKLMGKNIQLQQIKQTLFSLAMAGIKTTTLWLIGYPGETEEDFQQTLDLIEEMKDYIYEAEGTPFWYYLSGQSNSPEWKGKNSQLLYPENAGEMLLVQTWILAVKPTREESYNRLNRFTQHLKKLHIPNIYTSQDIYQADERWQRLHQNAVPPLVAFTDNNGTITENKNVQALTIVDETDWEEPEFGF